jgi:hypothetical protein
MKQKVTLIADEGKILTDGTHYARIAYLIPGDDGSAWHEIPEEEYAAITAQTEAGDACGEGETPHAAAEGRDADA